MEEPTNDKGEKVCAFPGCACLMQEEETFCSDACENATVGGGCACNHLACESHVEHAG